MLNVLPPSGLGSESGMVKRLRSSSSLKMTPGVMTVSPLVSPSKGACLISRPVTWSYVVPSYSMEIWSVHPSGRTFAGYAGSRNASSKLAVAGHEPFALSVCVPMSAVPPSAFS